MALITCPECGKEISEKASNCPNCGCPSSEWNKEVKLEASDELLDELYKSSDGKKVLMTTRLSDKLGCKLAEAKEIVQDYWDRRFPEQKKVEKEKPQQPPQKEFHGIYRYTFLGNKQEVYCPRCHSENCSHYKEQNIIPQETKTKYTVNLNPFKPFTLANKKEKVVRQERVVTKDRFMCNSCGMIFD